MTARYKWFCPVPNLRGSSGDVPWCNDLPCLGHLGTKQHVLAAEILGWADGYEDPQSLPDHEFREFLVTGHLALVELGHRERAR